MGILQVLLGMEFARGLRSQKRPAKWTSRIPSIGDAARSDWNKREAGWGLGVKTHRAGTAARVKPVWLDQVLSSAKNHVGMRPIQCRKGRAKVESTQITIFPCAIDMEPGIAVRIGDRFTQFVSDDVGHGVGAFIAVGSTALGGTSRTRSGRALGGGISYKSYFYISRAKRTRGMKAAKSRAESGLSYIRRGKHKIDSIGIHWERTRIQRSADDLRQQCVV